MHNAPVALSAYQDGSSIMLPHSQQTDAGGGWLAPGPSDADFFSNGIDPRGQRCTSAVIKCPKAMVGRVIGKNGETIRQVGYKSATRRFFKAFSHQYISHFAGFRSLQSFSGALIQINQVWIMFFPSRQAAKSK